MNYAGDINAAEAWKMIKDNQAALIDVRTLPEWTFVGIPDLRPLKENAHFISWQIYPHMQLDPSFVQKVVEHIGPDKDRPLLFLCRSGGRSAAAASAMTQYGYTKCYNIAHGFEGDKDEKGKRGRLNGWKVEGQPWVQE